MGPLNPLVVLALASSLAVQSQALQAPPPSPPAPVPAVSVDQANRVIAPQDLLRITVIGEADLTVQARVGADGMIPFPFINRTQAGGLTAIRFQQKLTAELADGW